MAGRLAAWAAAARVDEAAAARAREAFLRRMAGEEATFAGVLTDLAERGRPVVLVTTAGRRHVGEVAALGRDFVALRVRAPDRGRRDVLVGYRGIASVQTDPTATASDGSRPVDAPIGLVEALALLAEDRPRVAVVTDGGEGLAGELRAVGRDVLTLAVGDDGRVAYVAAGVVTEVAVV